MSLMPHQAEPVVRGDAGGPGAGVERSFFVPAAPFWPFEAEDADQSVFDAPAAMPEFGVGDGTQSMRPILHVPYEHDAVSGSSMGLPMVPFESA